MGHKCLCVRDGVLQLSYTTTKVTEHLEVVPRTKLWKIAFWQLIKTTAKTSCKPALQADYLREA